CECEGGADFTPVRRKQSRCLRSENQSDWPQALSLRRVRYCGGSLGSRPHRRGPADCGRLRTLQGPDRPYPPSLQESFMLQKILVYAQKLAVDLIALATHGLPQLFFGNVADK